MKENINNANYRDDQTFIQARIKQNDLEYDYQSDEYGCFDEDLCSYNFSDEGIFKEFRIKNNYL